MYSFNLSFYVDKPSEEHKTQVMENFEKESMI